MDASDYQTEAVKTAIYPDQYEITYPLLGLIGEVGEFANKYKKVFRDGKAFPSEDMRDELGDVLWYVANLCEDAGLDMGDVMLRNIEKLRDRQERGVLGGSGDNR